VASILDTFSCIIQGILPYGAQLLMGAALAGISPLQIIPYLYYPLILAVFALGNILMVRKLKTEE
jgi:Na+/H+ antiporter NhaC